VATVISVMVLRTQMVDCVKAAALADWLYWTQTSILASQVADHFGQTVASTSSVMQKVTVHHPHILMHQLTVTVRVAYRSYSTTWCRSPATAHR
jgi:uncharacterized protein involved in tolerance to divalent cations